MKRSLPYEQIAEFCRKWNVSEFALFGSVVRDDFRRTGCSPSTGTCVRMRSGGTRRMPYGPYPFVSR